MAKYKIIPSSRTIVHSPISIGHKAEKGVEAIEFDLTAWVETYGSGTLTVIMRRWGDAIPYPIALEIDENNKATWTLSDIDTAKAGMAYAQLNYIVGDEVVKKSDIYTFRVMDSLTGEGEPPEAYESWLEHLTHLAAEAMAEVLDIEGVVTDKTLTIDGGIADAKAAGDALALKADKSTTYTKTQVDQMIEDVEIETDTTLTISGAAADAAETGRQIGLLKADLNEVQISLGEKNLDYTVTVGGSIINSDGSDTTSETYSRINYVDIGGFSSVTINCDGNLGYYYYLYNAAKVHLGHTGWWYGTKTIQLDERVKYIRMAVRHPVGQTQISPTESETLNSISIVSRIVPDVAERLNDVELNSAANSQNIAQDQSRISALENLSGVIFNDYDVVVGGSIKISDGTDDISTTYSRVEYIDVAEKFSVTIDPGLLGAYIYTYNSEKNHISHYKWIYAPTTYHYSRGVKYIRVVMRYPTGQTQTSPSESTVRANLRITAVDKSMVSNERMRGNFIPASSTRYIYAKGKMWEYYWNTVKAIKAAAESDDCWGVSVDVRVTADGYLVCFHDATVDNQTDGTGQIEDMTWAEVQALNIDKGVWNGSAWVAEEGGATGKIPLLSDAIDACRLYGKVLLIEPKAKGSSAIGNLSTENLDAVISLLRNKGMLDSCGFIAPATTQTYLENHYPNIFRYRLYDGSLTATAMMTYAYDPNTIFGAYNSALTAELVSLAHQLDMFVVGYTPRTNPQSDDVEMVGKGLDGIFLFREPPVLT